MRHTPVVVAALHRLPDRHGGLGRVSQTRYHSKTFFFWYIANCTGSRTTLFYTLCYQKVKMNLNNKQQPFTIKAQNLFSILLVIYIRISPRSCLPYCIPVLCCILLYFDPIQCSGVTLWTSLALRKCKERFASVFSSRLYNVKAKRSASNLLITYWLLLLSFTFLDNGMCCSIFPCSME